MEIGVRSVSGVYGAKSDLAVIRGNQSLNGEQYVSGRSAVLTGRNSNAFYKFLTTIKGKMAEAKITWFFINCFFYPITAIAIWDNWGNWKSTVFIIAAALLYLAKFAKHILDAVEGVENFIERRKHNRRTRKHYQRKNKKQADEEAE
jgi:hypothetical protein